MITCKAFKVGFLTDSAVSVLIEDDTLTVQSKSKNKVFQLDYWTFVGFQQEKRILEFKWQNRTLKLKLQQNDSQLIDAIKKKVMWIGFHQVYIILDIIGKGVTSQVYKVKRIADQQIFAVKIIKREFYRQFKDDLSILHNELNIHSKLESKYLLKLEQVFYHENKFAIVYEYLAGLTLEQYISQNKVQDYSMSQIKRFMRYVLQGLEYLHSKQIMHRDIKPSNMVFSDQIQSRLVIIDFGMAIESNRKNLYFPRCGTPGYVAPEIISVSDTSQTYTSACDIFSTGIVFYRLYLSSQQKRVTGRMLVRSSNLKDVISVCQQVQKSTRWNHYPQDTLHLLKSMVQVEPYKRITASQALQLSFFEELSPTPQMTLRRQTRKCSRKGTDSDMIDEDVQLGYLDEKIIIKRVPYLAIPHKKILLEKVHLPLSQNLENDLNLQSTDRLQVDEFSNTKLQSLELLQSKVSFYSKVPDKGLQRLLKRNRDLSSQDTLKKSGSRSQF